MNRRKSSRIIFYDNSQTGELNGITRTLARNSADNIVTRLAL